MIISIPIPIPVPTIILIGGEVIIDRTPTELAKGRRKLGGVLSFDDGDFMPICCACKEFGAHLVSFDAPEGFKWGGWFCHPCLSQGKLAKRLGLIIDQMTCDIEPILVFDRKGQVHNGN